MGEATLPLTKSDAATLAPLTPSPPPPPSSLPPPPTRPMKNPNPNRNRTNTSIAIVSYLISLPLLCYGMWLLFTKDYNCQDSLNMPHLREAIGIGLIVTFVISCFVTHYEAKVVLPGALTLAIALLTMMTFGILLIGSYSMESREIPASPLWIKSRIDRIEIWDNVKSCIYNSMTCPDLAYGTIQLSPDDFNRKKLSAIEFGCCKPPSICRMEYVNATYWKRPKEDVATYNTPPPPPGLPMTNIPSSPSLNSTINPHTYGDCQAWSNEITQLCYDCQSCKQGFISTVHHKWRIHGIFMITMSVILLLVHTPRFILTMMQSSRS